MYHMDISRRHFRTNLRPVDSHTVLAALITEFAWLAIVVAFRQQKPAMGRLVECLLALVQFIREQHSQFTVSTRFPLAWLVIGGGAIFNIALMRTQAWPLDLGGIRNSSALAWPSPTTWLRRIPYSLLGPR